MLAALRRAFKAALAEAQAKGLPGYVWKNGKIIDIAQRPPAPGAAGKSASKPASAKPAAARPKSRRAMRKP